MSLQEGQMAPEFTTKTDDGRTIKLSDFKGKNVPTSTLDARPTFQMAIYPAYTSLPDGSVPAEVAPSPTVPPTFLVQAENDYGVKVESSVFYFLALKNAKVPAEMHIYAEGGHGFGLRPTDAPVAAKWPVLAEEWLHTIHVLSGSSAK